MLDADSGVLQLHKQWHIDLFFLFVLLLARSVLAIDIAV